MKFRSTACGALCASLLIAVGMNTPLRAGTRDAQWQKVKAAMDQGLPRTAITNLEPIITGALRDHAYAEAVKAIGQKINLEGVIEGNKPEEKITRLESEIAKAPKEMVPMLDTILAHWYWQYFQQNRWRFMQRTTTAQAPGKDFTTWDLPSLFGQIDRQFQKALSAEAVLKAAPIAAWDDLLQKGTVPDAYRPTLYDFIAHEALAFYTSGEQAAAKPQDAFELSAESPVFDSARNFIEWNVGPMPAAGSADSPVLRALQLYQALLRFHQNDPAPQLAWADADLDRLTWAYNAAAGETKKARYKAALESFVRAHADEEISGLALEREAQVLQEEDDLVAAHDLAKRGAQLFPQSPGGKLCRNLAASIEGKAASITTERVWNCFSHTDTPPVSPPPAPATLEQEATCPTLVLHYRNVEAVYFRIIPFDWEAFLDRKRNRPENLSPQERREVLARTPALEWSVKLPATTDFKEKTLTLSSPDSLKPGFYFIASSHDPKFGETENLVSMADVWVSDLSLVTRQMAGKLEGFVLEAGSGEPIAGAEVARWHLDQGGNRIADPPLTTDENGFFSFKPGVNAAYLLRARHQGRQVATASDLWSGNWVEPPIRPTAQTVFFTDRAIYRPGQTIQYKGICLWVDQSKDNYEVLKGEPVEVVFTDQNGKAIARQTLRANDYGSFSGSFTAPRDRLMGQMQLQAQGRARGETRVRVEEYKRPKFQVTLDAPKTAARLNEKVSLSGHAMSYTGAAVDGAPVKYRIVREVRMPWWWGWWGRGGRPTESQEIAHGTAQSETDGSFRIEFTAKPDLKVPEQDEPTFDFHINAEVTDSTGETRTAERSIRVGYIALEARLTADDWQVADHEVEVNVATKTLDDEPQVAEGSVKIYELQAPERVHRAPLAENQFWGYRGRFGIQNPQSEGGTNDVSNPNNWVLGKVVVERGFTTDTNGTAKISFKLTTGAYRAIIETQDRFGKKVAGKLPLQVLKPDDTRLALKIPHLLASPDWEAQPGEQFVALWGTGYDSGRAFIEIEHRHQLLERYWTKPGQTQQQIKLAVTEAMRGGFTLHVTQVRENRAYMDSHQVEVPWRNKELEITWEHFVSKLQPGQKETWTAVVKPWSGSKTNTQSGVHSATTEKLVAEFVAALYDESLDAFAPHGWLERFNVFREDSSILQQQFVNATEPFQPVFGGWNIAYVPVELSYRSLPPEISSAPWAVTLGGTYYGGRGGVMTKGRSERLASPSAAPALEMAASELAATTGLPIAAAAPADAPGASPPPPKPDLSQVTARKNLNETAFFYPQLTTDSNGIVRMTFTMPEALTKWRLLGFAHDRALRSGFIEAHAVTAKDLMVQPNPPRFLREGDTIEFTVKVSNQSDKAQTGTARLTFADALTGQPADKLLNLQAVGQVGSTAGPARAPSGGPNAEQEFNLPPKQSRSFAWRISVPDGCGFLTYKAVGAAANVSDGEEGAVPVLSRRVLITESLPLPIRGPATKKFEFTKLLKSGSSKTLKNQSLTVQMVSQPAWYAVLALPYLMEYPYECSEQVFNRLYANSLARSIAGKDPKIHRVFEQWRNTPGLDSPLEKNQDLKSVALEETPWLRDAQNESQARRNVGVLFDDNRLNYETARTLQKLLEMQLPDGAWPWFPGGQGNDYITLYITTGFGRLRHLGVDIDVAPAVRSLQRLDTWMAENYDRIQKRPGPEKYVPSSLDALYLYGRSFFLKDQPIADAHKKAVEFYLTQSRKFWLETNCRQTQGQLAIALSRFSGFASASDATPSKIMASLKERSVSNEEMGRFWRDTELSWWWYHAPIETQALMIEAFDEVAHDNQVVEDCKVWLLKQKQTQDWKTTKATADAIYALLLRGRDLLSSDALVEVKLDGLDVTPKLAPSGQQNTDRGQRNPPTQPAVEPDTGFYERRFAPADIKPKLGEITVRKVDQGVAWGSVHWQYLEDISKVTPYQGTPLKLKKSLFTKTATNRGLVLEPMKGPVPVGDELVVRIELRVDRDMEFVHLKDQRGSGTEPVNVLSQYKYQDGLGYFESTRDTASHFFIDYLPKGTYVFEYSTRVQLRGQYQTGVAEIQCLYAPEFNSHSESIALTVK